MKSATLLGLAGLFAVLWMAGCGRSVNDRSPPLDGAADVPTAPESTPPPDVGKLDLPGDPIPDLPAAVDEPPLDSLADDASPGEAGGEAQPPVTIPATPTLCAITAKLVPTYPDGGDAAMPPTHMFSLLVDWTGNTATTGAGGTANRVALVQQDGVWTTQGALILSMSLSTTGSTSDLSGRPLVNYKQIAIRPTAGGCAGQATGDYLWNSTDMLFTIQFHAELVGTTDQAGPVFSLLPTTRGNVHPLDVVGLAANELLPAGTSARWVASDETAVPLSALPTSDALGVSGYLQGNFALAFATSYRLDVLPGAADLAGNLAAQLPSVATLAGPGLLAQDGFEGTVDALLGGKVAVIDATSLPIPAGAKAIHFAPMSSTEWSCDDRFTARLAVPAGAKAIKLSTLPYQAYVSTTPTFGAWLRLAVPNGPVADFGYTWSPTGGTELPSPWTGPLPGADKWSYGKLSQIELALPPGTSHEIIFDLVRPCNDWMRGGGLVIDDLRVE